MSKVVRLKNREGDNPRNGEAGKGKRNVASLNHFPGTVAIVKGIFPLRNWERLNSDHREVSGIAK
jgi:hypothetical protein